jgi:hypothetical protein
VKFSVILETFCSVGRFSLCFAFHKYLSKPVAHLNNCVHISKFEDEFVIL